MYGDLFEAAFKIAMTMAFIAGVVVAVIAFMAFGG